MNEFIKGIKLHRKRRKNYKVKFDEIWINNRWKRSYISRSSDWTILGVGIKYFSTTEFEYYIAFFGFDLRIFFKRIWKV